MAFDPATATADDVPTLTGAQARQVSAHYGLPDLPKSAKVDDLRRFALTAIRANTPAGELPAGPPPPDAPVALEAPDSSVVPAESRFSTVVRLADYVSKSALCPEALRGKPNDIGVIMLNANDLGVPLMAAVNQFYVVKGRVGMEAKLMRAIVRRDGHSISAVESPDPYYRQIVHGKRVDNGDEDEAEFTLDDAVAQGLIRSWSRDGDGRITVVADDGKKPWRQIPRTMLKNRATSILCRDLFPDCLAGVSYTPDELGDFDTIDEPGGKAPAPEGETMTEVQTRTMLVERISRLEPDLVQGIREEVKRLRLPGVLVRSEPDSTAKYMSGAALGQMIRLVQAAEAAQEAREAEHDDAVVLSCALCSWQTDLIQREGDPDNWFCADQQACMERVALAAAENTAAEAPGVAQDESAAPAAPAGPEPVPEPVAADEPPVPCREPGGCPNTAVADGYCAEHAPM